MTQALMGHTELYQVGFQQDGPGLVTFLSSQQRRLLWTHCGYHQNKVHMLPLSHSPAQAQLPLLFWPGARLPRWRFRIWVSTLNKSHFVQCSLGNRKELFVPGFYFGQGHLLS